MGINDKIDGAAGDDEIYGGVGNDTLIGGAGNDFIETGYGEDRVIAGAGRDVISITFGNTSTVIKDFDTKNDKIDLNNFGISSSALYGTGLSSHLEITQNGRDTIIREVSGDHFQVTLVGVSKNSIDYADFSYS